MPPAPGAEDRITVSNLTMAYGDFVIQRDLNFTVRRGEVFIIMGGSGCGKSTLLRHLIGLMEPARGDVRYDGEGFWEAEPERRELLLRRFGVLYQRGALWSSMTLAENVALPLKEFTTLGPAEIQEVASLKLALVGLAGFEEFYPAEISGGMQKRAGLARAMALDPDILFFDEPSAGLDPISSKLLDDLILQLRDSLGGDGGGGQPRAAQHLRHRGRLGLPGRRDPDDARHGKAQHTAEGVHPPQGPGVPHPGDGGAGRRLRPWRGVLMDEAGDGR